MVTRRGSAGRSLVAVGALAAVGIAAHTAVNLRHLRRPNPRTASNSRERVSVLIPARDEAATIGAAVRSVRDQQVATSGVDIEVIVLDDGSQDDTDARAREAADDDPRVRVITAPDEPPPSGWLGKPWACARLAQESNGSILVFMDADVELAPDAVVSLVDEMRAAGLQMAAPYPRQEADGLLPRLVQPLVTWSWIATMPLRWAERSTRPSLSAANGQVLAMDAAAYRSVGGHASVASNVIEDVGLMRAFKRAGYRTATVDGSHLARCRMYSSATEVVDGYGKSLWAAFNGPAGSIGVNTLLLTAYVVPAVAAVTGRRPSTRAVGALGYAAGVASRALVARRTGEPVLPDTLAHPASIMAFAALNVISWARHLRGTNTWKGRPVSRVGASLESGHRMSLGVA